MKNFIAERYGKDCEGVGMIDGKVCFVPFLLSGEKAEIDVVIEKKNYCVGRVLNLLNTSECREKSKCPYFEICGGCDSLHMNRKVELEIKTQKVADCFKNIAKNSNFINKIQFYNKRFNYRNKVAFAIEYKNNNFVVGLKKKNSHNIIEVKNCLLAKKEINEIFQKVRLFFEKEKDILPKNVFKFAVIRVIGNCSFLAFVVKSKIKLSKDLLAKYFNGINVFLNINNSSEILKGQSICLFGDEFCNFEYMGLNCEASPNSFYQVNDDVAKNIYEYVGKNIDGKIVINAYSGAGVLSAMLAKKAEKVVAIEIEKSAHKDAEKLKTKNNIENLVNLCGDCKDLLGDVLAKNPNSVLVLDPPRSGIDSSLLEKINESGIGLIIYISCEPSTLARDVLILDSYIVKCIQPFDMFPCTSKVETVCVLTCKNVEHYMKLKKDPFDKICSGKKTIELRLLDEKRRQLKIGDTIIFTNMENGDDKIKVKIVALHKFDNFENLYKTLPLAKCGYDNEKDACFTDMNLYYSVEEQEKFGVVGIEILLCDDLKDENKKD